MKILSAIFIILFLAFTQTFAIIDFTLKSNNTWTGGDWGVSEDGTYTSHMIHNDYYATIDCENSSSTCFEANQNGQDIDVTIFNLAGGGGSGVYTQYTVTSDSLTGQMIVDDGNPTN